MSQAGPAQYRSAAERCRRTSAQSENSREWVVFAQNWEQIAEVNDLLSAIKMKSSMYSFDKSTPTADSESCTNPRGSLLFAGSFVP